MLFSTSLKITNKLTNKTKQNTTKQKKTKQNKTSKLTIQGWCRGFWSLLPPNVSCFCLPPAPQQSATQYDRPGGWKVGRIWCEQRKIVGTLKDTGIWPNGIIFHQPYKAPWNVMGCQVATCFKAPGVWLGGSGVSIGGVRILREPRFPLKYGVPFPETSASFGWVFAEVAMIWPEEYLVLGIGFIPSLERGVRILAKIPSMFKKSLSHCKQIRKPFKNLVGGFNPPWKIWVKLDHFSK